MFLIGRIRPAFRQSTYARRIKSAPDWPPAAAVERSIYLREGKAGADVFVSDPANPVPVEPPGGEPMPRSSMFRPVDRRVLAERADVLVYTSPAQKEELVVAGNPRAELWVSVDARDADFAVKLVDVWPGGAAYPVAEGVLRLTHRDGDAKAAPVTPGAVYKITVDLGHTAFALAPGHALRVEIAGSYFPAYDRNLHTGEGPFSERAVVAKQTVYTGGARASRVVIPVVR